MTGRAMGYCAGYNVPGYANFGFGRRAVRAGRSSGTGSNGRMLYLLGIAAAGAYVLYQLATKTEKSNSLKTTRKGDDNNA